MEDAEVIVNTLLQPAVQIGQMDRTKYLGGSDTAAILGVSPWKSAFQLYQEKTGEYHEEITPAKQKIFNRGKRWEPVVIESLIDELEDRGHDVQVIDRNNRFIDLEHNFLAAEIDLEVMIDGEIINGEMKTVHPFAAKDWGEQGTDEIPMYYTAQVLHGQMVTGRNRTVVAALIGADDLRVHFVDRDEEMINIIRAKEIDFWQRIQMREPPEPTTAEDIKRLYQIDSGEIIEATDEILELCLDLKALKDHIKQSETSADVMATRIKSAMGEAALLVYSGQKLVTWKTNKASTKTDWEKAFWILADIGFSTIQVKTGEDRIDFDAIIKQCTKTEPGARPFLIK